MNIFSAAGKISISLAAFIASIAASRLRASVSTVMGLALIVSVVVLDMNAFIPLLMASINAMPIIPMLPAIEVSIVLPFFVIRLRKERDKAVMNDILVFSFFALFFFFFSDLLFF